MLSPGHAWRGLIVLQGRRAKVPENQVHPMFARTDLRFLDKRYHEIGLRARQTTRNLDDWSEAEIKRWDLDNPVRKPTGADNPETWRTEKPLRDVNRSPGKPHSFDVRRLPTIGRPKEAQD